MGVGHYMSLERRIEASSFFLEREPGNEHDENAIRVHLLSGEHIGYISAALAKVYAQLLDRLGDKFLVSGVGSAGTTSSRIWVDLPRVPALRKYVSH